MNKNLLLSAAFLLSGISLCAQRISDYTWPDAWSVTFNSPWASGNATSIECPPWIIAGDWRTYFFGDGGNSYVGSSPLSMTNNTDINPQYNVQITSPAGCNDANAWKTNYYVTYSAQLINHPI